MTLTKVKKGYILRDNGLKINFDAYGYSPIMVTEVYLYRGGVLVAIYENREAFDQQIKRC